MGSFIVKSKQINKNLSIGGWFFFAVNFVIVIGKIVSENKIVLQNIALALAFDTFEGRTFFLEETLVYFKDLRIMTFPMHTVSVTIKRNIRSSADNN